MRKGDTFEWWACSACGVLGEDEHEECCEGARQERRAYVAVDALLSDAALERGAWVLRQLLGDVLGTDQELRDMAEGVLRGVLNPAVTLRTTGGTDA